MGNAVSKRKCEYPECSREVDRQYRACSSHLCPVVNCYEAKVQFQLYCSFHLDEW